MTDALDRLLEGYRFADDASDDELHAHPLSIGDAIGRLMLRALLTPAPNAALDAETVTPEDSGRPGVRFTVRL